MNRLNKLRELIDKFYSSYNMGNELSLLDLANYFNIPVDVSRLDDYKITKIDLDLLKMELLDESNGITYSSNFTSSIDLLERYGRITKFNHVISSTSTYKIERYYDLENDRIIIEKLSINDGDYGLEFEREYPNEVAFFVNNGVDLTIRYIKNYDKGDKQVLLNRSYKDNTSDEIKSLEMLFNSPSFTFKRYVDIVKYIYNLENNVIYGIEREHFNSIDLSIRGVCIENLNVNLEKYLPDRISVKGNPFLTDKNNLSAMIFYGFGEDDIHSLKVYKSKDGFISIKYSIENKNDGVVFDEKFNIPTIDSNNISFEEIKNISSVLIDKYNNEFINIIGDELFVFGEKIDVRKGFSNEIVDDLNPKLYRDKSLEEIAFMVDNDREKYFKLLSKHKKDILMIPDGGEMVYTKKN